MAGALALLDLEDGDPASPGRLDETSRADAFDLTAGRCETRPTAEADRVLHPTIDFQTRLLLGPSSALVPGAVPISARGDRLRLAAGATLASVFLACSAGCGSGDSADNPSDGAGRSGGSGGADTRSSKYAISEASCSRFHDIEVDVMGTVYEMRTRTYRDASRGHLDSEEARSYGACELLGGDSTPYLQLQMLPADWPDAKYWEYGSEKFGEFGGEDENAHPVDIPGGSKSWYGAPPGQDIGTDMMAGTVAHGINFFLTTADKNAMLWEEDAIAILARMID